MGEQKTGGLRAAWPVSYLRSVDPKNLPINPMLGRQLVQAGVSGIIGQSCVYPMYSIKTRMHANPTRYNNILHCFLKVRQHEGMRGLYRGLAPALVGVAPEKAIKLVANDSFKSYFKRRSVDGTLSLWQITLSGGGAGMLQLVITNPWEMTMIAMQTQSSHGRKPKSTMRVVRTLGLSGLYRGISATALRDVPFSAVFFSTNHYLSNFLEQCAFTRGAPTRNSFLAGILSGIFAATLSTPMDVIKTRVMADASGSSLSSPGSAAGHAVATSSKSASTSRQGLGPASVGVAANATSNAVPRLTIRSCTRQIWKMEGWKGFFNGVLPRNLIIPPLFGITMATRAAIDIIFPPAKE